MTPAAVTSGYHALRHAVAWLDLSARGRLTAHGRDAARFLHNVTSNDIKKIAPAAGCYAFLLTSKGRIEADLSIFRLPDPHWYSRAPSSFLIDTEPELREKVLRHLLKYKVADQVEFEDVTGQTATIGVEGPSAEAVHLPEGRRIVLPFTVTGQPGFRVWCAAEMKPEIVAQLEAAGAHPATPEDARTVRIENGRPRYGEDISDQNLPQETQQLQAVSFNKGCYIGQEIVERIRSQGHVNRKLVRLELDAAEPPAPGTKLAVDGAEAEVTSAVYSPEFKKVIALAYTRQP